MSLIACPACGMQLFGVVLDDQSPTCPQCGNPIAGTVNQPGSKTTPNNSGGRLWAFLNKPLGTPATWQKWILDTVSVGILIGCVVCGYETVRSIIYTRSSKTWPITAGTITESWIKCTIEIGGDNPGKIYRPIVRYQYQVARITYIGTDVGHFDRDYSQESDAQVITTRYPVKSKVEVHYQPDNAAVAVLEPGMKWTQYLGLAVTLVLVVFGVLLFLVSRCETVKVWFDWLGVIQNLLALAGLIGTVLALMRM